MANISLTTIFYAALGGMLPTFLWLWFWLTEDDDDAEPWGIIALTFIGGAFGVIFLLPFKPIVQHLNVSVEQASFIYASLEEITKFLIVGLIAFNSNAMNRATDYTIFLVTGALGFSALENTLYLINPIAENTDLGAVIITGNVRFFGATVLHTISVALVGVLLGLAYTSSKSWKFLHTIVGLAIAIGLHTIFNYFIIQDTRQSTIIAIAGIWVVAVIVILLFDRLRALEANIAQNY